jgi:hypothetical protein
MMGSSTSMPSARILRTRPGHRRTATPRSRRFRPGGARQLGRGELDVDGQVVFRFRNAVARLTEIVRIGVVAERLDRDAERAQLSLSRSNILSSASALPSARWR